MTLPRLVLGPFLRISSLLDTPSSLRPDSPESPKVFCPSNQRAVLPHRNCCNGETWPPNACFPPATKHPHKSNRLVGFSGVSSVRGSCGTDTVLLGEQRELRQELPEHRPASTPATYGFPPWLVYLHSPPCRPQVVRTSSPQPSSAPSRLFRRYARLVSSWRTHSH